jgi:peptide/nickel transport system permease protein
VTRYIWRRGLATVTTVLLISAFVFVALQGVPGDAAIIILGDYYGHEEAAALRERLGLDKPLYVQYGRWLGQLVRGNFGISLRTGQPVRPELASRLPVTVELAALSLALSLVLGVPLGVISAIRRRSAVDYTSRTVALLGISIPNFWLGLMLILIFGLYVQWVPSSGYAAPSEGLGGHLATIVLPVVTLGSSLAGTTMRITRAAMLEVLGQDYVRTGRAKGLGERLVITRHALRNALIPLITVVGLQFGDLLGRTVIVEEIFSLPGLGRFVVGGVFNRDYPVVMAAVLVISVGYTMTNLAVDILYARVDPRIRYD